MMTYQSKQEKGPNIKLRLNNLEAEINNIRDVLTKRKANNVSTLESAAVCVPRPTASTSAEKMVSSSSQNRLMANNDICNYLQNITKHIAKGSEAIRRIASLTEVSSLSHSGVTPLVFSASEQDAEGSESLKHSVSSYYTSGVFNSFSDQSITGYNRGKIPLEYLENAHQNGGERIPVLEARPMRRGIMEVKKQILQENYILKQKLADENALKNELVELKKKLKEEAKKRIAAEMKAEEIQKTLSDKQLNENNVILGKTQDKGDGMIVSVEERLSILDKKYAEERKQREELEKEMSVIRATLEENERQKAGLSQTRDIALALADKLWSRCERRESSAYSQGDIHAYKPYLNKLSKTTTPEEAVKIYEKIKEQILAAEKRHKSEQKDPLENPKVRSLIENQRKAYQDLENEKSKIETEQEEKIKYLEASLGHLQQHYNIKTRKLLDRVQELTTELKSRTTAIEASSEKKAELAGQKFKETLVRLEAEIKQQEEVLKTKEQIINKLENEMKTVQKELDDVRQQCIDLNKFVEETQSEMSQKSELIENMKLEIDSKNDALAIKDKMIVDNVDTIKALKTAVDAHRQLIDDMKNSSNFLKSDKTRLEKENEKLSRSISHLEKVVDEANAYKAAQERNLTQLKNLETQVYERQKEWEQQLMRMSKEKDEAIQAARYATQKLYRTVQDFENQLTTQKEIENMLRRALESKEADLVSLKRQGGEAALFRLENRRKDQVGSSNNKGNNKPVDLCTDFLDGYTSTSSTTSTDVSIG